MSAPASIPGAFLLGIGRIGNFIDGQIVGRVTDVWWAVKFPDAEGFRHPVVLYDGAKNLLLIPLLLWSRRRERRVAGKDANEELGRMNVRLQEQSDDPLTRLWL